MDEAQDYNFYFHLDSLIDEIIRIDGEQDPYRCEVVAMALLATLHKLILDEVLSDEHPDDSSLWPHSTDVLKGHNTIIVSGDATAAELETVDAVFLPIRKCLEYGAREKGASRRWIKSTVMSIYFQFAFHIPEAENKGRRPH